MAQSDILKLMGRIEESIKVLSAIEFDIEKALIEHIGEPLEKELISIVKNVTLGKYLTLKKHKPDMTKEIAKMLHKIQDL